MGSSITIPKLDKDQQYAFKISYGTDQSTYSGLNTLTTACFMEGTKILCQINNTEQYVPIENIKSGMLVNTYKHGYKKVIRNGVCTIYDNNDILGSIYKKDKTDDMTDDLYITGGHSILVDTLSDVQKNETLKHWNEPQKIDDKYLLLTAYNKDFTKYNYTKSKKIYHMALENENKKGSYGIYANGVLVESISEYYFDFCTSFKRCD